MCSVGVGGEGGSGGVGAVSSSAPAEARQESCAGGALSGQDAASYQTVCPGLGVGVLGAVGDTDLGALGLPQILSSQSIYYNVK